MNKLELAKILERAKANHAAKLARLTMESVETPQLSGPASNTKKIEDTKTPSIHIKPGTNTTTHRVLTAESAFRPTIQGLHLNEKQSDAVELAMRGRSFNLIGAAGTGKTTTTREIIGQLVRLPHISPLQSTTKHLAKDSPGIVIISFTNKAVNNLKKFLPEELKRHCLTYHKLLQYEPKMYELEPGNPAGKKTMRFEPTFTIDNPLPHISCIIVEESSMVGDDLHKVLLSALPAPEQTQFIFLGDLNQLPPIFGPSILGFKLLDLPTVELNHVYRQALESPIITLAHQIREGRGFLDKFRGTKLSPEGFIDDRGEHGKVTIHPWKKKQNQIQAVERMKLFLIDLIKRGKYDYENDVILCPFNKSFGTLELNRAIADYLGKQRQEVVYEVIARGTRSYWAVGDHVLVDRREAIIQRIEPTAGYSGAVPVSPSESLDRWGRNRDDESGATGPLSQEANFELLAGEDVLDTLTVGEGEDVKNSASHTITVLFNDTGTSQTLSAAGDVNGILFSYVLTVHKSQGSEWKRVFILLHYTHNTMLSRELLYTAVTRAKQELFIVCEPDYGQAYNSITKAAKSPEIQGVTLQEKAEYFKAKKRSTAKLADVVDTAKELKRVASAFDKALDRGEDMVDMN